MEPKWKSKLIINGIGLLLTSGILVSLCVVKFDEGGWVTLLVTGVLISVAFWVKHHYRQTQKKLFRLNELVAAATGGRAIVAGKNAGPCDANARTAVFLVNGFNGLGLHTLLAVVRMFPKVYRNFVFVQVGVLDAGNFKGASEVENLREHSRREVDGYVTTWASAGSMPRRDSRWARTSWRRRRNCATKSPKNFRRRSSLPASSCSRMKAW